MSFKRFFYFEAKATIRCIEIKNNTEIKIRQQKKIDFLHVRLPSMA